MELLEFIKTYNQTGTIILLEGKRNVKEADKPKLEALGKLLAQKMSRTTFRSGNADGSDLYFSKGVASIAPERLHVVTPYKGHRKNKNYAGDTLSLDSIDLAQEPEVVYESKSNKKMERLIDKYVSGENNRFVIKAAYIIRDTVKVLGTNSGVPPIAFALFYDDEDEPRSGGTGHTINVCERNKVPFLTQQDWIKWLD
jgi:hypothetical protein